MSSRTEQGEPPGNKKPVLKNLNNRPRVQRYPKSKSGVLTIQIKGEITHNGIQTSVSSENQEKKYDVIYPQKIWERYPESYKEKILDNALYVSTAHIPFLHKRTTKMTYNTGYPTSFSWGYQCIVRHFPMHKKIYKSTPESHMDSLVKTLTNTEIEFCRTNTPPHKTIQTSPESWVIPFTFGKDSFLTYHVAKELGIKPILAWFHDPPNTGYEGKHKEKLFKKFQKIAPEKTYYISNELGELREDGEAIRGWELALTSWAILGIPIAHHEKAKYIMFSNEISCNASNIGPEGYRLIPDFEQSGQATEEISHITQAISGGSVHTSTVLQGIHELGVLAILKDRYAKNTFPYLMSCWSEIEEGKNKRWCGNCTKCARIFAFLTALGIDPIKEAGYMDNMFEPEKEKFFNGFGHATVGIGWDAFGLNEDEQGLSLYLTALRGHNDHLIEKFKTTPCFQYIHENFETLLEIYFGRHQEEITPIQWKQTIDDLYDSSLQKTKKEITKLSSTIFSSYSYEKSHFGVLI